MIDHQEKIYKSISLAEALRLAKEAGLDLVEVNPTANPPVCKIMDYGQYQYQQSRQQHESRQKSKKVETKGIRLSFKIGQGDLQTRQKQTEKFLKKGSRVRLELFLRGRERQHGNMAIQLVKDFIDNLSTDVRIEQPVLRKGNTISAIIINS